MKKIVSLLALLLPAGTIFGAAHKPKYAGSFNITIENHTPYDIKYEDIVRKGLASLPAQLKPEATGDIVIVPGTERFPNIEIMLPTGYMQYIATPRGPSNTFPVPDDKIVLLGDVDGFYALIDDEKVPLEPISSWNKDARGNTLRYDDSSLLRRQLRALGLRVNETH
jgi:hypothetical protein